ncbi:MAG: TlpA family protein disulfide reductase [Symbiobacteriaceae bacterium]|nr:TlpA family protein disulfide reductase [Symbiobacteriaceae bacterium]
MRHKWSSGFFIALAGVLLVAVVWNWYSQGSPPDQETTPPSAVGKNLAAGDVAPEFSLKLLDGTTFSLKEQQGKVVFINFWATWCSPCVVEMPDIQKLYEEYKDVVFLGVNVAEQQSSVVEFLNTRKFTYPNGIDPQGELLQSKYPSTGIPYTVIVDAKGRVSTVFLGTRNYAAFKAGLQKALG